MPERSARAPGPRHQLAIPDNDDAAAAPRLRARLPKNAVRPTDNHRSWPRGVLAVTLLVHVNSPVAGQWVSRSLDNSTVTPVFRQETFGVAVHDPRVARA